MMKNFIFWLLVCLLPFGTRAQVQLGKETFEEAASDVGYTTSPPFDAVFGANDPSIALQYFQRITHPAGTPYTPWSSASITLGNQQGGSFWGAEGVRGTDNIVVRPPSYVQLEGIATSNYENLKITVAFSAPRGAPYTGFGRRGVRVQDKVLIQYSFDGVNYTDAGRLTGSDGTADNLGFWKRDANNNGTAGDDAAEPVLNQAFTDYTFNVNQTGSLLRVRIVADYAQSTATELAFDNIRVTGTVDPTPRPVLTLATSENAPLSYAEGAPAVQITNTLGIAYASGTTLTGATVEIPQGSYEVGQDVLGFTAQNGISAVSNANGVLTLTGTTTLANYQAALRSVTYQNTNATTATGGARPIVFTVLNGTRTSNTATRTISVTATLNGPAALPYTEDFETNGEGTRYTATTFANSASLSGFFRATASLPVGPGGVAPTTTTFSNYNGAAYWFGEGSKTLGNPAYPLSTLQLAPVDATNTVNLRFTLRMGAGTARPWDADDFVKLYYRTSSTGVWTLFGAFYGIDATNELRRDINLDGVADATGTSLTASLQDVIFGDNTPASPLPNSLAVAALEFKIEQSTDDEDLAFDYIRITGTAPPTVTTALPGVLTVSNALLGGNVTSNGGSPVTGRGVVYSATNATPTIGAAGVIQDPFGTTATGAFAETIGGLAQATTYSVRAYATNIIGTSYGAVQTFTTPASIVSIVRASDNPTNAGSVSYTVTFGASVSNVTASNFTLAAPGLSGVGIASVTGTGNTRTVVVSTGTGTGTLQLLLANATGTSPGVVVLPFAGETYTIDRTAPEVTTVGLPANGTYTVGQVLGFTVNFSEAVTVTGTPQLPLRIGGIRKLAAYAAGSGTAALVFQYTVQRGDNEINGVNPSDPELNGGTIRDAATNAAVLRLNGVPTSGVLVDGVPPTVTSLTGPAASGSILSTSSFEFTVIFSEVVTNFSASGITVTNGSVASGPTGRDDYYTFIVTPAIPGTPTTVTIAAGAARDGAGGPSVASAPYSLTYLPPNVTVTALTGRTPTPTATATVTYKVTFSGAVLGLNPGNFGLATTGSVSGASVVSVRGVEASYLVVVNTGTGDGTLQLNLTNSAGTIPGINGVPNTSGSVYQLLRTNTFGPNPRLTIQGGGSAGDAPDVTAFLDLVQVLSGPTPVAGAVQNGSFETNNVDPAGFKYGPQVSAAPWVFNTRAGVARQGSGFGAATSPPGDAVAFIQSSPTSNGSLEQRLALAGGSYQVSLQASQRTCCGTGPYDQELYILVNGVCLGAFQPATSGYTAFASVPFNVRGTSRVAGQLLRFAGNTTPGYVNFSADAANPAPLLGSTYTQTAWVRPAIGTGSATYYVLGNGTGSTASPYLAITGDGRIEAGFGNGTELRRLQTSAQTLPAGVWSQVAATYDRSYLTIYLNGQLQIRLATGILPVDTRVNFVGSIGTSGSGFFPGDIDEVSQWTRALSEVEIRQLRHLTLSGAEPGLASYLQFNEAGTTITDFVSGTVGTLVGAVRTGSTAPVGYGTSTLASVTGAGSYDFAGTSAAITFGTPGTTPYDVVVSRLEGPPLGTQPTIGGLQKTYTPAYWIVDRYSATPFAATITYKLSAADVSPADAASFATTLRLFKRGSNDDGPFTEVIAANAANAAAGTISFPVTSFSQTVIGTLGASPLPVELLSFTAEQQGSSALVQWTTAQELNNKQFEVDVSPDGQQFARLGTVAGRGTYAGSSSYRYTDAGLLTYGTPVVYYRLRQVDQDGTFRYSPVRAVRIGGSAELTLFPNPARTTATLSGAQPGAVVTVSDALSRQVLATKADTAGSVVLHLPSEWATGVYIVRVGARALRLLVE